MVGYFSCLCVVGAMFADLELAGARSLLRDQYMKGVPLSDWCVIPDKTGSTT